MGKSKIEWTDATWPVVTGCRPVSEGCRNCYAAREAAGRLKHHLRYKDLATIENGKARWAGKVRLNHDVLEQPLRWRKPRMIFVASMGDLFHADVPFTFIAQVFDVMYNAPQHTYQVLTKRPYRMKAFIETHEAWCTSPIPGNIWLGVSAENQAAADERIPLLLQTPAAVRFASVEPMLGEVDLQLGLDPDYYERIYYTKPNPMLDWVICGGESGPNARPMHPDWARSLRDQCQAAGVPFFFKQWGAWTPNVMQILECKPGDKRFAKVRGPGGKEIWMARVGKKAAGHLLDGRAWREMPPHANRT